MILADAGPLVALFDPTDAAHARCVRSLRAIRDPLRTTVPVLTEAFHMLGPGARGATSLRQFVAQGGITLWFLTREGLLRAFELMERYADHPMDLADASLVVAAEHLQTRRIFTLDRRDFETYRVRRGHREFPFEVLR